MGLVFGVQCFGDSGLGFRGFWIMVEGIGSRDQGFRLQGLS